MVDQGERQGPLTTQTSNIYVCSNMDNGGSSIKPNWSTENQTLGEYLLRIPKGGRKRAMLMDNISFSLLQCFLEAFDNLDLKIWKI